MKKQVVAFNQCIKVYVSEDTYIQNTNNGRYLIGVWAQYADKELVFKKKLKLNKGKLNREYVNCYDVRCYIIADNIKEV